MKKLLTFGILLILTSCFYTGKYFATYTVQNRNKDIGIRENSINFINQLADKNSLKKDPKYNEFDTLGFFGQPYHYFKFWFEEKDTIIIIKFDYWGTLESRSKNRYKDLFKEFNNFMNENFIILEEEFNDESNSRKKD